MSQSRKVHRNILFGQIDVLISRLVRKSENKKPSMKPVYSYWAYILDISEEMRMFCKKTKSESGVPGLWKRSSREKRMH